MTKRILVVEDDDALRMLLELSLEIEGFGVITAANGEEAKAVLDDQIDLIVTDLQMPVLDGLRLVEWVRAEIGPRPTILVLTAQSVDSSHEQALEAGANGVAFKPIDMDDLLAQIATLLEQQP